MPRRTSKSTSQSKGAEASRRKPGSEPDIPEHMPAVTEFIELKRIAHAPSISAPETIYVRTLFSDSSRVYVDICGVRRTFFVEDIHPGSQGHPYRTADVHTSEWDRAFGRC